MLRNRPALLALLVTGLLSSTHPLAAASSGVLITKTQDDRLRVEIDGQLFTEYRFQGASRPFLYPVLAADGTPMTRQWPMEQGENEERDHPHHRSLWFTHGEVNGVDFWSESTNAGRTVHDRFLDIKSGANTGLIRARNQLLAKDGTQVGTVDYTIRIHRRPGIRLFDFEAELVATHGELHLGDTKEGTLGIRLAETLRLKPNAFNKGKPTGHIINSEGLRDDATWGKRAAWVDYYGPVAGKTLGVAILDHPSNPRHPTWWHVRDYGLFAANPFGIHDFEKKPAGTGDLKIPAQQSAAFRYRFVIHSGNAQEGQIADLFKEYSSASK